MKRRNAVTTALAKSLETTIEQIENTSTFHKATMDFLKHCRIKGLSSATIKFYQKELKMIGRAFTEISVPVLDVRKIKTDHIENFIEHQQEKGRAINTINALLRAGRTFFNFCLQKKYISENPFEGIQQLKKRHEVGATFSKQQLKRLLNGPDITSFVGLRDLAVMLTFAHTGIRLTELTSLRLQDISFDGKGAVNIQYAKNRYARRIPLTKRLKQVLKAYIAERGILDNTDALFITLENQPLGARTIQERLKYYGNETGVEKEVPVSPHAFRRTFCRLKVEAGTNIFVLQRLSGHQSLEILRRYVEIYGKDLEQAIEQGFD
jgi:integrase/recombinase XerD